MLSKITTQITLVALVIVNFSQLALAQIDNFHNVVPGIDRSARPSSDEVIWIADNSYKSILNLEAGNTSQKPSYVKAEEKQALQLGLQFLHIPMHPTQGPTKEQIDQAHAFMIDPANQPVLVHCHFGKDRTGMVIAAYRMKYQGWSYDDAVAEMKNYGFSGFFTSWLPLLKEYESTSSTSH